MNKKIDLSEYEGHTTTHWSARNQGDGSLDSCDDDYEHDEPFLETDGGDVGIGYMGGRYSTEHSIEEKRANMRLMADAHLILGTALRATKRLEAVESMLRRSGFWVSQEGWDESDKGDEMLVSLDYLIQYYQDLKDSSEGSEGDHMHTRSIGDADFGQGNGELESNYGDGQPEWYSGPNM